MMQEVTRGDLRLILLGEVAVGKSTIRKALDSLPLTERLKRVPTAPIDFAQVAYDDGEHGPVLLDLYDTAGEERYHAVTQQYLRGVDAAILVYDLQRPSTFDTLLDLWVPQLIDLNPSLTHLLLLGNKRDVFADEDMGFREVQQHFYSSVQRMRLKFPTIRLIAAMSSALTWTFLGADNEASPVEVFIAALVEARQNPARPNKKRVGVVVLKESRRVRETRQGREAACWQQDTPAC